MTDLERAREIFDRTAFATERAGCVIDAVEPGWARCSMALTPEHMNPLGVPMGGAIFTLADFAFGVASNFGRDVFVSSSAEIHFLASSRGSVLYAEAKEIRSGRKTCLFSVDVTDDLGVRVACVTVSGIKIRERGK